MAADFILLSLFNMNQLFHKYQQVGLLLGLALIFLGSFLPWQCFGGPWGWACQNGIGISLFAPSDFALRSNGGLILSTYGCFVVWLNLPPPNRKNDLRMGLRVLSFFTVLISLIYLLQTVWQINIYNDSLPQFVDDYGYAKLGFGVLLSFIGSMLILVASFYKTKQIFLKLE